MTGLQGLYEWLATDKNFDLLKLCPNVALGKYVAITSIDSGEYVLNDDESATGWRSHQGIAYSPKIQRVEDIAREGWDEWYIFNNPTDLGSSHLKDNIFEVPQEQGHLSVLVNYGFALHPPDRSKGLTDLFWQQLARVQPESYVADNDYLTFACVNKALFASVHEAIRRVTR